MAENPNIDPELIKKYLDLMKEVYGVSVTVLDLEKAKTANLKQEVEELTKQKKLLEASTKEQKKQNEELQEKLATEKSLTAVYKEQAKTFKESITSASKFDQIKRDTQSISQRILQSDKIVNGSIKDRIVLSQRQLAVEKNRLEIAGKDIEQRKKDLNKESRTEVAKNNPEVKDRIKAERALLKEMEQVRKNQLDQVGKVEQKNKGFNDILGGKKGEMISKMFGENVTKSMQASFTGKGGTVGKAIAAGVGTGLLGMFGVSKASAATKAGAGGVSAAGGKGGIASAAMGTATASLGKLKVDPNNNKGNVLDMIPDTGNPYIDIAKKVASAGVERFKSVDAEFNEPTNLARSLNTTYENALLARTEMSRLASATNSVFVTGEKMAKATIAMNAELGTAVNFEGKRLQFQTQLRNQLKGSSEEVQKTSEDLLRTALITGDQQQTEESIFKNRLAQVRLVKIQLQANIDERKVLMDIAKASNSIRINYLGNDEALTKAAASARALGTELSKVDATAASLLDFNTSIQSQMEAELLSGQNLNLERARYYALTNDIGGLTQELNNQNITAEKFGQMNRLAQEATAKALGMSRDDMSGMLIQQRVISALGTKDLETAKEEYKQAVMIGREKEFLDKLGDKSLADQFSQMSMQERMAAGQEKMAMAMEALAIKLAGGVYESLVTGAETTATLLNLPQGSVANTGRQTDSYVGSGKVKAADMSMYARGNAPGGLPSFADGGLVKEGGIAKVDTGELFLGRSSAAQMNRMVALLEQMVNKPTPQQSNAPIILKVNDQVLATAVATNASTVPGNLLNPGSSTYS